MAPLTTALALSRVALGAALIALIATRVATRRRPANPRRNTLMLALATLALGMALFALFFGLVAGSDRL